METKRRKTRPFAQSKPEGYDELRLKAEPVPFTQEALDSFCNENAGVSTVNKADWSKARLLMKGHTFNIQNRIVPQDIKRRANEDFTVLYFRSFLESRPEYAAIVSNLVPCNDANCHGFVPTLRCDLFSAWRAAGAFERHRVEMTEHFAPKINDMWMQHAVRLLYRLQLNELYGEQNWWVDGVVSKAPRLYLNVSNENAGGAEAMCAGASAAGDALDEDYGYCEDEEQEAAAYCTRLPEPEATQQASVRQASASVVVGERLAPSKRQRKTPVSEKESSCTIKSCQNGASPVVPLVMGRPFRPLKRGEQLESSCGHNTELVSYIRAKYGDRRGGVSPVVIRRWFEKDMENRLPERLKGRVFGSKDGDIQVCHIISKAKGGHDWIFNYWLDLKEVNCYFKQYLPKEWDDYIGRDAVVYAESFARWVKKKAEAVLTFGSFDPQLDFFLAR